MQKLPNFTCPPASKIFEPIRSLLCSLKSGTWPSIGDLNRLIVGLNYEVANKQGIPIRFVIGKFKPTKFDDRFEPRAYLRGEVAIREKSWHDLFNALVWMRFPKTKAEINARHYQIMVDNPNGIRTPAGDALTAFDEDGVIVVSSDANLTKLIESFRWKDLFWKHRHKVSKEIKFVVFGHAMYEKLLNPYVGVTAKSIILEKTEQNLDLCDNFSTLDLLVAPYISDRNSFKNARELHPIPVLGIPSWYSKNERECFYDNMKYFRPGRRMLI